MRFRNIGLGVAGAFGAAVAVKMLTRAATVRFDDVASLVPHSDHSRFLSVDSMRVHYQEFGRETDPAIVLIHGYTASAYVWRFVAPRLADAGFRVLAIDLIGFGYSDKPRGFDYTIASQAQATTRFMDRLGIGRATLVGSSYGGAVAATIALDEPERVEKLVLVSAVCNDDLKNHPILKLVSVPALGEVLTPFLADSRLLHRFRMRDAMSPANHHLATEERIDAVRRPLHAADGHHSLLATSRNWDANRIEQDAHLITQPTLIIWGEDDRVVPIHNGYKLHDSIAGSRFVVLTNCGHLPHEERSGLFTQFVGSFVAAQK